MIKTSLQPFKEINKPLPITKKIRKSKFQNKWTEKEYNTLITLVKLLGEDWLAISKRLINKTPTQCMQKFKNSQKSVKRGNWTPEEDKMLLSWVDLNGPTRWTECSKFIYGRCGKQCRERWINILNPKVKKGNWSEKEQLVIFGQLCSFRTSWSSMTDVLEGRTENAIKNYFYSSLRRLKSSSISEIVKNVYLKKIVDLEKIDMAEIQQEEEWSKMNLLCKKICEYLLGRQEKDEDFVEFMVQLIFNKPSNLKTPIKRRNVNINRRIKKKVEPVLFVPNEQPAKLIKDEFKDKRKFVISVLNKISRNNKEEKIKEVISFLEKQLFSEKGRERLVEEKENGINIKLPFCWNCKMNDCFKHQSN